MILHIKILMKSIYANKKEYINYLYSRKLNIDYNDKKIYICIYDRWNNLIDNELYWDFDDIKSAIKRKLRNLALIKYNKKIISNLEYFKYESIKFYKLKDFSTFMELLEKGIIRIYVCLGIYKSGYKKGKEHDHGIVFGIKECDLLKLYDIYLNKN